MLINEIHFNRNGRNYKLLTFNQYLRLKELDANQQEIRTYQFEVGAPIFKTFVEIGTIVFRSPGGDIPPEMDETSSMTTVANVAQLLDMVRQVGNFG